MQKIRALARLGENFLLIFYILPQFLQVTVKPPLGAHGEKESLPATSSVSIRKAEPAEPSTLSGDDSVHPRKQVESSSLISKSHLKPGLGVPSASAASSGSINVESDAVLASAAMDTPASVVISSANEARTKVPGPVKDMLNEPVNTGQTNQVLYVCVFVLL